MAGLARHCHQSTTPAVYFAFLITSTLLPAFDTLIAIKQRDGRVFRAGFLTRSAY